MVAKSPSHPTEKSKSQARTASGNKRHILVAEDDSEMRQLLSLALTGEGYNVIECCDGNELSLCLREASVQHSESVDLVISDVRMPGLTGLGVLKIHGQKQRCPPIILMTAFGDQETREEARHLGAIAFFDKPFGLDDLIEKVRATIPP